MRVLLNVALVCLLAGSLLSPLSATDPIETDRAERGKRLFRIYCTNCHGNTGLGDGPSADLLLVKPADLTRIRAENGGRFPFDEVLQKIDGRAEIESHGPRQMPIWGIALQEWDKDTDQRAEIAGRLLELTTFVKSIQRPAEEP